MDNQADFGNPSARLAVGTAAGMYTYFGLPLSDWVAIATLIYLAISIFNALPLIPQRWAQLKEWFKNRSKRE